MNARVRRTGLKSSLISAAWELFASSGYDATTIERIIDRVRVSKGAFYHYFSNKEEVLDAVVDRMILNGLEEIRPPAESESLPALQRLNAFLAASRKWRLANMGVVLAVGEVLLRDENIIIRHKIYKRIVEVSQPLLSRMILQGVREGIFDVADPEETSILLLHLMNVMSEIQTQTLLQSGQNPEGLALLRRRAGLYLGSIERILAAPKASIELVGDEVFEKAAKSIRPDGVNRKEDRHGAPGIE